MKSHFKKISLAVPVLLLAFTTLAAVPAFAKDGSNAVVTSGKETITSSDTPKVPATSGTTTTTSGSSDSTTENKAEVKSVSSVASDDSQTAELHSKGKTLVADLQKEHKSKLTDTERQKVCEVHKQGLTNKFTVIARNSKDYQTRIDDVYTKALAFQASKNVTSADLTNLIATADAAKLTSATSVANLLAVTPTLDCNNVSVAQDVATFKTAVAQTRTDLKTYKAAVKAVVQALKTATQTVTNTTTPATPIKSTGTGN